MIPADAKGCPGFVPQDKWKKRKEFFSYFKNLTLTVKPKLQAMKKLAILFISCVVHSQPTSFSWGARASENQVVDVPCHIFASVSAVETWYQILYGQNVD